MKSSRRIVSSCVQNTKGHHINNSDCKFSYKHSRGAKLDLKRRGRRSASSSGSESQNGKVNQGRNAVSLASHKKVVYGIPLSLAFLLYLNTLPAGFVYDDHRAIVSNPDVIGVTPLHSLWKHDFWGGPLNRQGSHGSWRPLTTLSFRINALWAGLGIKNQDNEPRLNKISPSSSWHFHAVNVLLHVMVTGVYVAVLESIGTHRRVCLFAGSLFASHPVHVEAVGGVVGRAELLAALAFCLALGAYIFYLRGRPCGVVLEPTNCPCLPIKNLEIKQDTPGHFKNSLWLWCSLICALVGVMCKEQAVTSLGVALILHCTLIVCVTPLRKNLVLAVLQETWLPSTMAALIIWWRASFTPSLPSFTITDNPAAHSSSLFTRTFTILRYWVEHARLLLLPDILSFDWSMGAVPLVSSVLDRANLPGIILISSLLFLASQTARRLIEGRPSDEKLQEMHPICHDALNNNYSSSSSFISEEPRFMSIWHRRNVILVVFSMALTIVSFLPASNLWAWVGFVAAERVLYLPSMGVCLLVAQGAYQLTNIFSKIDISLGCQNLKSINHLKIHRRRRVKNCISIIWFFLVFMMSVRTIKRNYDWHSDETLYRSGLSVCPAKALANLGVVYSDQGRLNEAEQAYRSALRLAPQMADTHYNLGLLLANRNRLEEAKKSYQDALRCRPWLVQAHLALAYVLTRMSNTKEAKEVLRVCLQQANAPAKDGVSHTWALTNCRQRLARLYVIEGQPHEAIEELQKAYLTAPPGYPIHALLTLQAEANVAAGEHADALEALNKALRFFPAHIPAHLAFSRLLIANGSRIEEAEHWLRKAVSLAPDDAHALKHLGQLLLEQGRAEESIEPWLRAVHLDPEDHTATFNAATALRLAGRNQHSEIFYRKAVKILPKDVSSQRNLGAILHLNGKLEEALEHYKIALSLAPRDPQTTTNLQRLTSLLRKKSPHL